MGVRGLREDEAADALGGAEEGDDHVDGEVDERIWKGEEELPDVAGPVDERRDVDAGKEAAEARAGEAAKDIEAEGAVEIDEVPREREVLVPEEGDALPDRDAFEEQRERGGDQEAVGEDGLPRA